MTSGYLRLLFFAASVTPCFSVTRDANAQSPKVPCRKLTSCVKCASDTSCRWTIELGCMTRSRHANDSIMSQGNFIEDPAKCAELWGAPLRCWIKNQCDACLSDPDCHWCTVTRSLIFRRCSAANDDEACPADKRTRDRAACEPDPLGEPRLCPKPNSCDDYISCNQCALDPACGWCNATERCHPQSETGACDGKLITWRFQCPPVNRPPTRPYFCQDPCAKNTDCTTCVRDAKCGWCPVENRCRWGTTNVSTCTSGWAKSERACPLPAVDPCARIGDCITCMKQGKCHWCPDSKRCERESGVCGGVIFYSVDQCPGASTTTEPVATVPPKKPPARTLAVLSLRNATRWSIEFAVGNTARASGATFASLPIAERVSTTVRAGQWLHARRADRPKVTWKQAISKRLPNEVRLKVVARGKAGIRLQRDR